MVGMCPVTNIRNGSDVPSSLILAVLIFAGDEPCLFLAVIVKCDEVDLEHWQHATGVYLYEYKAPMARNCDSQYGHLCCTRVLAGSSHFHDDLGAAVSTRPLHCDSLDVLPTVDR
jgi:hypothetical protein